MRKELISGQDALRALGSFSPAPERNSALEAELKRALQNVPVLASLLREAHAIIGQMESIMLVLPSQPPTEGPPAFLPRAGMEMKASLAEQGPLTPIPAATEGGDESGEAPAPVEQSPRPQEMMKDRETEPPSPQIQSQYLEAPNAPVHLGNTAADREVSRIPLVTTEDAEVDEPLPDAMEDTRVIAPPPNEIRDATEDTEAIVPLPDDIQDAAEDAEAIVPPSDEIQDRPQMWRCPLCLDNSGKYHSRFHKLCRARSRKCAANGGRIPDDELCLECGGWAFWTVNEETMEEAWFECEGACRKSTHCTKPNLESSHSPARLEDTTADAEVSRAPPVTTQGAEVGEPLPGPTDDAAAIAPPPDEIQDAAEDYEEMMGEVWLEWCKEFIHCTEPDAEVSRAPSVTTKGAEVGDPLPGPTDDAAAIAPPPDEIQDAVEDDEETTGEAWFECCMEFTHCTEPDLEASHTPVRLKYPPQVWDCILCLDNSGDREYHPIPPRPRVFRLCKCVKRGERAPSHELCLECGGQG